MDTDTALQLITLIILLLLSAFFSSAETALTTVSRLKVRTLADNGSHRAKKVLVLTENSGKLLSTILIGNNLVNIYASALTTSMCTELFGSKFIGISTGILTFAILIFGEITPKTIASMYSLPISMFYVYPIWILTIVLTPIIIILNLVTNGIFKLLHITSNKGETITESELRTMVNVSHEEGVIEPEEKFMISNVVDFGDALSKDIMIPRADVIFADIDASYEELVKIFMQETYSRMPVFENSKDNVIGILYLKDLFFYSESHDVSSDFNLREIIRKPVFVYEYQKTSQIFADMKTSSFSFAIVLDEYGVASGIITMEDLIEEIVGEIRDEYDDDEVNFIKTLSENLYDIDASIKLSDLNDALGTNLESDDYDSLAGFVIELMDKLPDEGETAIYNNLEFKVKQVNKNRVERIELAITPHSEVLDDEKKDQN